MEAYYRVKSKQITSILHIYEVIETSNFQIIADSGVIDKSIVYELYIVKMKSLKESNEFTESYIPSQQLMDFIESMTKSHKSGIYMSSQ